MRKLTLIFLLLFLFFSVMPCFAATKEWTGYVSNDWNNADNWDNYDGGGGSGVPANGDSVSLYFYINYGIEVGPSSPVTLASFFMEEGAIGGSTPDFSNVSTTGNCEVEGPGTQYDFGTIGGTLIVGPGYSGSTTATCTSATYGIVYGGGATGLVGGTYGSVTCSGSGGGWDIILQSITITNNLIFTDSCLCHDVSSVTIGGDVYIYAGSEIEIGDISSADNCYLYGNFSGGNLPSITYAYTNASIFSFLECHRRLICGNYLFCVFYL